MIKLRYYEARAACLKTKKVCKEAFKITKNTLYLRLRIAATKTALDYRKELTCK